MDFQKVAIIGPGLIGASLGMAIRARGLAREVVGIGRRQSSLDTAVKVGAIERGTLDLAEGVAEADLVVLAAGVATSLKLGLQALPNMKPGSLLTDVASAKAFLINGLEEAVPDGIGYISTHPMAGSEQKGPAAAREDLFDKALCLFTPTAATRPDDQTRLRTFWQRIGSRVVDIDSETHDRLLAQVSHLPHIAAACLISTASTDGLEFSAGGFRDTTRIASGDAEIWRDICMANKEALRASIQLYIKSLEDFSRELEAGDADAVEARLREAKQKRDDFYRASGSSE